MTPQKHISARAWGELLLLAMIWGGSFIANRLAIDEIGVLGTVAFRVTGACLLLWLYVALRGLPVPRSPRIWGAFLVMGALNNAIPFSLITWAQLTVPSGLAAILNASTALMGVVVASIVFRDEKLTGRRLAGVLLGLAGVTVVIGLQALTALDLTSLAQLTLLVAALSYACAAVWGRLNLSGLPPQVAAAGMLTGSTVLMVPAALAVEGLPPAPAAGTWLALAYLAVVSTAGAYLLYYRVLALAGAGNLSLVTLLTAPFAVILGAVVLGESLPLRDYLGFALITAGLVAIDGRILQLAKIPREIRPPVR